jgi:hypothetical protein
MAGGGKIFAAPHAPPLQPWPVLQTLPHWPQLLLSVWVSTHVPLQIVSPEPGGHEVPQPPPEQTCPVLHVVPQLPQFLGSPAMRVHVPLHGA